MSYEHYSRSLARYIANFWAESFNSCRMSPSPISPPFHRTSTLALRLPGRRRSTLALRLSRRTRLTMFRLCTTACWCRSGFCGNVMCAFYRCPERLCRSATPTSAPRGYRHQPAPANDHDYMSTTISSSPCTAPRPIIHIAHQFSAHHHGTKCNRGRPLVTSRACA